jgi:Dolichyl-phosphate-mannose-protein mannosyltransferase
VLLSAGVFLLRLSQLHQGLYGDEVWTHQDVVNQGFGAMIRGVHTGAENSPPLFFILAWLSAKLGDPTVLIRLPSLLLGTATIPLLYLVGREIATPRAGLLGAALLGISPFSLYYGVEARPYATMAFFVVLSTWALLRAVDTRRRAWWIVYSVAVVGAAYSHYTSVFVLGTQAMWSLWVLRDRLREPLAANAISALLYLPWISHIRGKSLAVIGSLQPLNAHNVVRDLARVTGGYPYAFPHQIPTVPGLVVLVACAVGGAAWWLVRMRTPSGTWRYDLRARLDPRQVLLILLTFATPVGLLLYSMLATDLWLSRGLYASLAYGCLLLACALLAPPRAISAAIVVAVLGTYGFGTIRALSPTFQRPQFRELAGYLDRVAGPRDPVVADPLFAGPTMAAEFHRAHRLIAPSSNQWQFAGPGGTTWVVLDDASVKSLVNPVPYTPLPQGFRLIARRHYSGLLPVTLLGYRRQ